MQLIPHLLFIFTALGLLALVVSARLGGVNLIKRTGGDDIVQDDFFFRVTLYPVLDTLHGGFGRTLALVDCTAPTLLQLIELGCHGDVFFCNLSQRIERQTTAHQLLNSGGNALTEQLVNATNDLVVQCR